MMNPAITLAFMFNKGSNQLDIMLGLCYFIAQFAGGFCGALLYMFSHGGHAHMGPTIG